MRNRRPVLALAAALLLAGCGGGSTVTSGAAVPPQPVATVPTTATPSASATPTGSPLPTSEADAIKALVTQVEVIHAFKTKCSTMFTSAFIVEAFGSLATCEKAGFPKLSEYATSVTVDSITGDGTNATGVVTDHGGIDDGSSGAWQFVRTGGTWKVSDQSAGYLRAEINNELGSRYDSQGATDPFATAGYRNCVVTALQAKDDATVKSLVHGLTVPKYAERIASLLAGCSSSGPDGESPFRALFEKGLRLGAGTKVPSSVVDCTITALRTAVSDVDLIAAGLAGKGSPQAIDLEATAVVEARKCAAKTGTTAPTVATPQARTGIRRAGTEVPTNDSSAGPAADGSAVDSPATDAPTPAS